MGWRLPCPSGWLSRSLFTLQRERNVGMRDLDWKLTDKLAAMEDMAKTVLASTGPYTHDQIQEIFHLASELFHAARELHMETRQRLRASESA